MDRLRVVPPYGKSFLFGLDRDSVVVGRSATTDLHIPDRFLSRRHARLFCDDGAWWIEDLASRNGSWLNGRRLDCPTQFRQGDRIRLSNSYILFGSERSDLERTPSDFISSDSKITFKEIREQVTTGRLRRTGELGSPTEVRRQAEHLRLLNRFHNSLSNPIGLEDLLEQILDCAFEALEPDQGVIFLRQPAGDFHRAAERTVSKVTQEPLDSKTLIDKVAIEGLAALVRGVETDPDWTQAKSILDQNIKSLVASPLADSQGSLGMIALTSHEVECPFGDPDLELLVSLASIAALRIRNMLLVEESAKEAAALERLDEELKLARRIQVRLMPGSVPQIEGYELRGSSIPCRRVSGDYYQVIARDAGNEALVVLADVVGKGLGASLLTASLEALAIGPIEVGQPPAEICTRVGRRLHDRTTTGRFATMFVASMRTSEEILTFTNAGNSPGLLIRRDGEVIPLHSTGPPLGLFAASDYKQSSIPMASGDLLVLYTDGITEAADPEDREYGIARLTHVCRVARNRPLHEIAKMIESDLASFATGRPFDDDRTMVMARRH